MSTRASTRDPRHSVQLHIEELVLHGFAPADRHSIGEAVQRELARLFVQGETPPALVNGGERERLDGGTFQIITPSPKPQWIGEQVARAVFEGLK